jgi:hypothetical protein
VVFTAAAIMSIVGALASLFRGRKYVHLETKPVETTTGAGSTADRRDPSTAGV